MQDQPPSSFLPPSIHINTGKPLKTQHIPPLHGPSAMTRSQHHHHGCQGRYHYHQQQQQDHGHPDVILLGAAALGAAVNHYTHPPRQSTLIVQQQQHPSSRPNPQDHYHPPEDASYFYIRRQNQPPLRLANATRLNTRPPGWRLQRHCEVCFVTFGLFNGRHHCRNCGRSLCGTHSTKRLPLPHWGFLNYVRVCDGCHDVVMNCFRTGAPYHPALLQEHPQHDQYQQQQVPLERLAFGQHWEGGATTMAFAHPYTPVDIGVEGGVGAGMVGEGLQGNANVCVDVSGHYGQQATALPYAEPAAQCAAAEGVWATASVQQQVQEQQRPGWPAQPSAPPLPGGDYNSLQPTTRENRREL